MINRLRFKNWRSLRDVEIDDLQPINVFIGANSSGKTNILDVLRFLQYANTRGNRGLVGAIRYKWGGKDKIRTLGIPKKEATEIEFSFQPRRDAPTITRQMRMQFYEHDTPLLNYSSKTIFDVDVVEQESIDLPVTPGKVEVFASWEGDESDRDFAINSFVHSYMTRRWQIFKELFTPQLVLPPGESDPGDLYVVEENGRNIVFMLDNMRSQRPDLYQQLEEDAVWLLSHVDKLETRHTEREMSLIIRERMHGGLEAPSISAGTARLISILTAFYALDMETTPVDSLSGTHFENWTIPLNEMPGLVVIEEPDTALNPGVLRNFVEQLRYYTRGKYPRQFILTTHNPAFLDYFEPEEVRVVTRDEQGYTQVNRIPDSVKQIWLDDEEHTLGEVWLTNSFGGLVE